MWVVLAVVGVLVARNLAGETAIPSAVYVPVNLTTGLALVPFATRAGLSRRDLGLGRHAMKPGLQVGAAVAMVFVALIAIGAAVPLTRPLFEDQRLADVDGGGELAYQALVRVPFGTALFEEFAFRGVLLALLVQRSSTATAVAVSSMLFGLWHIRPTLGALDANDLAVDVAARTAAVGGAVAATTIAGVGFCILRLATGSLLAPLVVHASINSVSSVAAHVVLRST